MAAVILEDQSLRDGLQSEQRILARAEKVSIFRLLAAAGVKRIQAGSFVHPEAVPQLADTDKLIRAIQDEASSVLVTALVLNERGLDRALKCGLSHLSMSSSASNSHSLRNVKRPAAEAFAGLLELIRRALGSGLRVRAGVQCAFGCVYDGSASNSRPTGRPDVVSPAGRTRLARPAQLDNDTLRPIVVELGTFSPRTVRFPSSSIVWAGIMAGGKASVAMFSFSKCPRIASRIFCRWTTAAS